MTDDKTVSKSRCKAENAFQLNMPLPVLVSTLMHNMPYSPEPAKATMKKTNGRFILSLELTEEQAKRLIPANG